MTKRRRAADRPSASPAAPVPRGLWWRLGLIAAAVVLTYANSLSGAFVLDDQSTIVDNQQIRELSRVSAVLSPERDTAIAGRPIVNLTFAINYAVGGLDVRGYHVGNITIHLLCAWLAFGLVRRTLELPRVRQRFGGRSSDVAFAVALLWAVHPINSEVVDYLTERTESLMAMFYLLTLYAAVRGVRLPPSRGLPDNARFGGTRRGLGGGGEADGPSVRGVRLPRPAPDQGRQRDQRWSAVAVLSCALGMACKESMVTSPVVVLLYDRVFLFDSFKQALRARRGLYTGLAAGWIVLAALLVPGPRSGVGGFSTGVPVWTWLLNQTLMIARYLRLTVWPQSLVVFYGWALPLTLVDVWPYALLVVALVAATAIALARAPLFGFAGAWFFITLAPTSSLVPIATEVGAERRMYLPLLGLIALAVVAGSRLLGPPKVGLHDEKAQLGPPKGGLHDEERTWSPALAGPAARWRSAIAAGLLAALTVSLAAGTVARNREYASALTLARTVVERRPIAVTHHYLAEQLAQANLRDEAIGHLRQAVAGGDSRAGYLLGFQLFNAGNLVEAVQQLEAFVATSGLPYRLVPHWLEPPLTEVITARLVLARAASMQSNWAKAAEQAQRVLAVAPGNREARLQLGDALFNQQRYEEAATQYREYLKAQPDDLHALMNAGIAVIAGGRLDEAIILFRRAVEVQPREPNARRILGMALLDRGDFEGAATQAREGLALAPNDQAMRALLSQAQAAGQLRAPGPRPRS